MSEVKCARFSFARGSGTVPMPSCKKGLGRPASAKPLQNTLPTPKYVNHPIAPASLPMRGQATAMASVLQASGITASGPYRTRIRRSPLIQPIVFSTTHRTSRGRGRAGCTAWGGSMPSHRGNERGALGVVPGVGIQHVGRFLRPSRPVAYTWEVERHRQEMLVVVGARRADRRPHRRSACFVHAVRRSTGPGWLPCRQASFQISRQTHY